MVEMIKQKNKPLFKQKITRKEVLAYLVKINFLVMNVWIVINDPLTDQYSGNAAGKVNEMIPIIIGEI